MRESLLNMVSFIMIDVIGCTSHDRDFWCLPGIQIPFQVGDKIFGCCFSEHAEELQILVEVMSGEYQAR